MSKLKYTLDLKTLKNEGSKKGLQSDITEEPFFMCQQSLAAKTFQEKEEMDLLRVWVCLPNFTNVAPDYYSGIRIDSSNKKNMWTWELTADNREQQNKRRILQKQRAEGLNEGFAPVDQMEALPQCMQEHNSMPNPI